jgi:hypothetical protein
MEETMRRLILGLAAALALLTTGSLVADRAEAMTLSTPAGIRAAVDNTTLAQDVAYFCRRVWRCGPYGCGWRQSCGWSGPRYYGSYGYRGYRSYGYRYGYRGYGYRSYGYRYRGYRSYGYARPYYRNHYSHGHYRRHY